MSLVYKQGNCTVGRSQQIVRFPSSDRYAGPGNGDVPQIHWTKFFGGVDIPAIPGIPGPNQGNQCKRMPRKSASDLQTRELYRMSIPADRKMP